MQGGGGGGARGQNRIYCFGNSTRCLNRAPAGIESDISYKAATLGISFSSFFGARATLSPSSPLA